MLTVKTTLVLGASPNPERYAHQACLELMRRGHPTIAIGKQEGTIQDLRIQTDRQKHQNVNTVSLYLNPKHQSDWYAYLLALQPLRIIFNPGAENPELRQLALQHGIDAVEACTLVLLRTGQY